MTVGRGYCSSYGATNKIQGFYVFPLFFVFFYYEKRMKSTSLTRPVRVSDNRRAGKKCVTVCVNGEGGSKKSFKRLLKSVTYSVMSPKVVTPVNRTAAITTTNSDETFTFKTQRYVIGSEHHVVKSSSQSLQANGDIGRATRRIKSLVSESERHVSSASQSGTSKERGETRSSWVFDLKKYVLLPKAAGSDDLESSTPRQQEQEEKKEEHQRLKQQQLKRHEQQQQQQQQHHQQQQQQQQHQQHQQQQQQQQQQQRQQPSEMNDVTLSKAMKQARHLLFKDNRDSVASQNQLKTVHESRLHDDVATTDHKKSLSEIGTDERVSCGNSIEESNNLLSPDRRDQSSPIRDSFELRFIPLRRPTSWRVETQTIRNSLPKTSPPVLHRSMVQRCATLYPSCLPLVLQYKTRCQPS